MNNTEYYDAAEKRIKKLMELRKQGISLAKGIIGETLFKEDFFFCTSADRSLNLIDGFADMLRKRNLTCVGALLRLQMDNCMRSYAAFIAKDKEAVASGSKSETQRYLEKNIIDSSANPKTSMIERFLEQFDNSRKDSFNKLLSGSQDKVNLNSLVQLRNDLSHGRDISASIAVVKRYYESGVSVLITLDSVL